MSHDSGEKIISNPNYVGPGVWFSMHVAAANAKDEISKESFKWLVNVIINNFKCEACKLHAKEYLAYHPIDEMRDFKMNGEDVGMLYWSWLFHNAVNFNTKKGQFEWTTCYNIYKNPGFMVCAKDCGKTSSESLQEAKASEARASEAKAKVSMYRPVTLQAPFRKVISSPTWHGFYR